METVDITIRLKKLQHDWLKAQSEQRQRSIAAILRLMIDGIIEESNKKKESISNG